MQLIALTGGIGSGKTTVSDIFKSKNVPVIDTDIIARQIVELDKPAYNEIIKVFGEKILNTDKNIDRQALRNLIFSSSEKRLKLEKILHPIIWDEVQNQLKSITSTYCIIVVPLLLENNDKIKPIKFNRILVIDTPENVQIKRATTRDNSDESIVKKIMDNQVSRQERTAAADDIILNAENLDSLNTKVSQLHEKYLQLSN